MYIAYFTALGITILSIVVFYVYMKNKNRNKKIICISYGLSSGEIERYVEAGNNTKKTGSKITVDSYQSLTEEGNDLLFKESFSLV